MGRRRPNQCSQCKIKTRRELLVAKRVQFREMGERGRVLATRVVDWLCPECLESDPVYNQVPFTGTPGLRKDSDA